MKIALDAMGGDYAPDAAVHGAVWAARDFGVTIQLVGQPEAIRAELAKPMTGIETWFLANYKLLFQAREGILEPKNQVFKKVQA